MNLPSGVGSPLYSPIVRLLDPDDPQPGDDPPAEVVRSLAVRKLEGDDELTDDGAEWLAEIAYRMKEAPHEALSIGRRFELYEGACCVATGVVIGIAGDRSPCSAMIEPSGF